MKLKLFRKREGAARRPGLGPIKYRLIAFFAVFGPGFITANVDNDPGGILTYSQAGAKLGYTLLWTLIPTTIALIVVQEMAARMGAVTGKGLADLIREEFGLRATFFTMVILGIADFGNIVAELPAWLQAWESSISASTLWCRWEHCWCGEWWCGDHISRWRRS